jgi:hypothetical protein
MDVDSCNAWSGVWFGTPARGHGNEPWTSSKGMFLCRWICHVDGDFSTFRAPDVILKTSRTNRPLTLCISFILAAGVVFLGHVLVTGQIEPQPTKSGVFSMELATFVFLLGGFISSEVLKISHGHAKGLNFHEIFLVLFSLAGSLSIYVAVIQFLGK